MRGTAGFSLRRLCGAYQNEIKKKAFVLIRARVLLLFWEHVGGCHPHGEHRLEEALGALMLFWVPQPSVLLGRGYRHYGESSPRGTANHFCLYAGTWFSAAAKHRLGKDEGQS